MSKDSNYYFDNPSEYDSLTDDARDYLLAHGELPDELQGVKEETDVTPDVSAEDETPVILGKSGQHTIPYSVLEETRAEAAQLRAQAEQQAALIKQLQEAQQVDAITGGTEAQEAVIAEHELMFPDIAEDIKPLIQKMIDDGIRAGLQQVTDKIAPLERSFHDVREAEAKALMFTAHPDIIDVLNSDSFNDWAIAHPKLIDSKNPSVVIDLQTALDNASPHEVNEALAQYKRSITPALVQTTEPRSKVDRVNEILAGVKKNAPVSMSDIPGAVTAETSVADRMLAMNDVELETAMLNMTEAQRDTLFARMA